MFKDFLCGQNIAYQLPNHQTLFSGLNFSLARGEKIALIGENGAGKSTLFNIISGRLAPSAGKITGTAKLHYVPQNLGAITGSGAGAMGIELLQQALIRVEQGCARDNDFEIIGSDWDFREQLAAELGRWYLSSQKLSADFAIMSGGEKEKLLLAAAFLSRVDILLLDEPTNNLDDAARNVFYDKLAETPKGCLIISHDRELLSQMTKIWELKTDGLRCFGGNYEFYRQVCEKEKSAKQADLILATKEKKQLQQRLSDMQTREARRNRYAGKLKSNRRYTPMQMNLMKSYAEGSAGAVKSQIAGKLAEKEDQISQKSWELKEELIKISLPDKPFLKERLVEIGGVDFGYCQELLFKKFNLVMKGGDRVALCGSNGCGKTTLIKLILGKLKAVSGSCKLNGNAVYLAQDLGLLKQELTLLDNVLNINPGLSVNEAYAILANFKFRHEMALKKVASLSGGELLRGCLAAILGSRKQPDLIILDEPTNNLDIASLRVLEQALCQYQGALLVVSHDRQFLENTRIRRMINLDSQ